MVDHNKVQKGRKISTKFPGGIYDELKYLRKACYAFYVLTHKADFTQEQIDEQELVLQQLLEINNMVEALEK